jgi:hypothetical protein
MITRDEFTSAALSSLSENSTLAALAKAGDPRVLRQIGAMATMLAMASAQADTAQAEPFTKTRDSTILADAALKGVLPLGRPCSVTLTLSNAGGTAVPLSSGRVFIDQMGRLYQTSAAVTVPAGGSASVDAKQITIRQVTQTVDVATPFYRVEVKQTTDDVFIASIAVSVGGSAFSYVPDWFNVEAGDTSYQVLTDELRRLWVQFGSSGVVGYGVTVGDQVEIDVIECEGLIDDLSAGDTFSLQYVYTIPEGQIKASLNAITDAGADAPSMDELRVLSTYPALYDHNAVYLGEFDMLLRRYMSPLVFLSVWNEQVEETARGASVNNINALFVSGSVDGMADATFQSRVNELISRADNSYRIKYVAANEYQVPITITGTISVVHDLDSVKSQIRSLILGIYSRGNVKVSRGRSNPIRNKDVGDLMRSKIDAFQDDNSDFQVAITLPATLLPEHFLYVTDASLTLNISQAGFGGGLWSF